MNNYLGKSLLLLPVLALMACGSSGGSAAPTKVVTQPVTETPVVEAPVVEAPIVETPAEDPVVETPVEEQPSDTVSFDCAHSGTPLNIANIGSILIEAENFDTCDASISAGITTDVSDSSNTYVKSIQTDEYIEYTVNVETSGLYALNYRLQNSATEAAEFSLFVNDVIIENSTYTLADDQSEWLESASQNVYLSDGLQVLKLKVANGAVNIDYAELTYNEPLQVSPELTVKNMEIGINLGNTLDAPYEGDWALKAELAYLVAYKDAGFNHVRIPATWHNHTATEAPYTIDSDRMDRTEEVVDWALAQGYSVILNMHHESWLKNNYSTLANQERFDAIWQQIAERFKNKSARLVFELLNEPHGMTVAEADDANERSIAIIRVTNPTRNVVFSGNGWTPIASLLSAAIPEDDYLIGNYHSYDPWGFAGQCVNSWGTEQDHSDLENIYEQAANWSTTHDIPVTVNEFGAAHYDFENPENICDPAERLAYFQAHVSYASARGIAASVWDDGGSFQIYNRSENTWGADKDILVSENNK